MAYLSIWLPSLIFAHAFALFFLLAALRRARPRSRRRAAAGQNSSTSSSQIVTTTSSSDAGVSVSLRSQSKPTDAVHLEWQALGCSYSVHGAIKVVLQDVWGRAQPGQMQALMGPSGAGKSTLMDMLALRKSVGNLSGRLLVNGKPATARFIRLTSYVPQDDTFIPTMSTKETLTFYAGVTLGDGWSRASRTARAAEVLEAVGLGHTVDTLVGGTLPGGLNLRGLSGGERKRLSIAAGILAAPSVVFLDEPTSGLDSFAALSVMSYLQQLAQSAQQTVIATIHQPRSDIWEMFDTVSLLSSGRLMFHGPCSDMVTWFTSLGYQHTKGSASDWVLDLVATGFNKPPTLFGHTMRSKADIEAAADAFKAHCLKADTTSNANKDVGRKPSGSLSAFSISSVSLASLKDESNGAALRGACLGCFGTTGSSSSNTFAGPEKSKLLGGGHHTSYPTSWWAQFKALAVRELAGSTRNPFDVAARVLTCTYVGLLCGLLAYNANFFSFEGLVSRTNFIFGSMMLMMLLPYVSISLYTSDKQIYLADASAKCYRPSAYYLAKVLVALPFNIISSVCYSGVIYGMAGLHAGGPQFGRYACIISIFHLIAHQVLHLSAAISPNYDVAFCVSVTWTTLQQLFCSFFISFEIVAAQMQWLTQLRYIAASYYSLEALLINEHTNSWLDCSNGLAASQVDMITANLVNTPDFQKAVLQQFKEPQPGCVFKEDVLLSSMGLSRGFGESVVILLGYLGVLHALTFVGLLLTARRERR